ncbi:D-alanyl-D-alanine carboxypeptidase/D-alanyl-D-alanine endopeptidase [Salinisphaera sp.]|uniref:D-alanyl-D-alanine carboxypeptidase/D-alanyl-D-alanine endopeptidase n=1 Tax=Salinisphaera sp. TaxID=1914330 RepID=UPI002D791CA8|nr:D-alanyl-D-alanine carboxypeptidase/D-alanyl-D-alanine-endopeptidase [Salinisphaera sp.]HET7314955.1 D-alanyl-D-alanine carboxypeptidase/D-alanyl-D-alanine-endopeptidase [Salinisphaera sp.]
MPSTVRLSGLSFAVAALLWSSLTCAASNAGLDNLRALARHADVSVLVVRLRDMHTIAAFNPDQRLRPASVSKLFAASAALQQFGPEHRFTSRFASHGAISHSTLDGDLVFVGGGDPSLDNRHLRELVMRLKARGVDQVAGDLVVDDGLWGTVPCLIKDRCDARERASHSYSAPLSSAGVNFGTVMATVYPGAAAGQPTRVVLYPEDLPGYRIDNRVKTGPAGSDAGMIAWRTYDGGYSTLHIRGSLPVGYGAYRFHRAVTGAAAETARVLSAMLANAGIHIAGAVTTRSGDVEHEGRTLARVKSESLAEQLIPMMAYSNNYMADTLTLDVAADSGYNRPLTLARASQALEALSERANEFAYPERNRGKAVFDSGSGLSLGNSISARDLVSLLTYMFHQTALFPAFYGSLPVPVSAPSRTLKRGNFDFETRLVAKTGTLTEPVTVRALAGYLRLSDGGFAAYGIVINGTQADPNLTYHETVTAYQHDLESILARH